MAHLVCPLSSIDPSSSTRLSPLSSSSSSDSGSHSSFLVDSSGNRQRILFASSLLVWHKNSVELDPVDMIYGVDRSLLGLETKWNDHFLMEINGTLLNIYRWLGGRGGVFIPRSASEASKGPEMTQRGL